MQINPKLLGRSVLPLGALGGEPRDRLPRLEAVDHLLTVGRRSQPVPAGMEMRRNDTMDR
jgi:hypothetical protein